MATPLRELFLEFFASFDLEGFNSANKKTEDLKENLTDLSVSAEKLGKSSKLASQSTENFGGSALTAASSTSVLATHTAALTSKLSMLANPITAAISAVTAIVVSFGAWLAVLTKVSSSIHSFALEMASLGGEITAASQRIGISTEQLTAWGQALAENNLDASRLSDGLTDLGEKMGEALLNRTSETAKTFKRLGIQLKDSQGRGREVGDVFLDLADAIKNTSNQAERIRIANQLMGQSGKELIPILIGGSEVLQGYLEQLRLTQPGFDEYIRNANLLGTEQEKLNQAWEGTKQLLFNAVAPAVIYVVDQLRELVVWLNNNKSLLSALKAIAIVAGVAFTAFGAVLAALGAIIFVTMLPALLPLIVTFGLLTAAIATVVLAVQDFYVFLKGGDSVFGRFLQWIYQIPNALKQMIQSLVSSDSAVGRFLDNINEKIQGIINLYNKFARLTGLDTIDFNLRETISRALPTPQSEEAVRAGGRAFVERQRQNLNNLFSMGSSSAMNLVPNSVVNGATNRNTSVVVNNNQRIEIAEASDAGRVREIIEESFASQNREIITVLSQ